MKKALEKKFKDLELGQWFKFINPETGRPILARKVDTDNDDVYLVETNEFYDTYYDGELYNPKNPLITGETTCYPCNVRLVVEGVEA